MGGSWQRKLDLTHSVEAMQSLPGSAFLDRALEAGLKEFRTDGWATSVGSLESLGEPLLRLGSEAGESALYERDGLLVQVDLWSSHLSVAAASADRSAIERLVAELRESFPLPDPSAAHEVPITFWTYTPNGAQPSFRTIGVPEWGQIAGNYSTQANEQLRAMMEDFQPSRGGQLILWHGEAGTGKTFALRALAWEWREWCQFHYIVDPDSFFGEHADYLICRPVATGRSDDARAGRFPRVRLLRLRSRERRRLGEAVAAARPRRHRRAAVRGRARPRRAGPVAVPQRRGRSHRSRASSAGAGHDQ